MNKVFKSSISMVLWVPFFIFFIIIIGFSIILCFKEAQWWPLLIIGLGSALILSMFFNTKYIVLEDGRLIIHSGFFKWTIDIKNIKKIMTTGSILNAPALSFDRIEIFYTLYDSIIISPKDKQGFVEAIKAINPSIVVSI